MNPEKTAYTKFALVREMLDVVGVIERFDPTRGADAADRIAEVGRLMLTGEGSSRIFPARNAIRKALAWGLDLCVATDGGSQAATYDLSKFVVFAASNSGKTREVIELMKKLETEGHEGRYGLTAREETILADHCSKTYVLTCGWEDAVAATKSVMEQALFYQAILSRIAGRDIAADLNGLAAKVKDALTMPIDPVIVGRLADAPTIYFAGYNDGVAEELTLKTNEIARKKSDYLEGTYAVHGIEEVMDSRDVVIVIDPIEGAIEKFQETLVRRKIGGVHVVAVSTAETPFETICVPDAGEMTPYVFLAAGWNLLVETGLAREVDLDVTESARKIGNEYTDGPTG